MKWEANDGNGRSRGTTDRGLNRELLVAPRLSEIFHKLAPIQDVEPYSFHILHMVREKGMKIKGMKKS